MGNLVHRLLGLRERLVTVDELVGQEPAYKTKIELRGKCPQRPPSVVAMKEILVRERITIRKRRIRTTVTERANTANSSASKNPNSNELGRIRAGSSVSSVQRWIQMQDYQPLK
jgi:hypothetical protein